LKLRRHLLKDSIAIVLLTAGATGLRYLFDPILGFRSPLLFHILAVAIAAQIAGMVSGLIATGFSVVLIQYFFVAPHYVLDVPPEPGDQLALLLFIAVGIALSVFGGRRKRAEDELRRIHYNLETAQHIADIGSWESDLVGKLWWSRHTYSIFGMDPGDEIHTDTFYDRVHPEDLVKVRNGLKRAIETNTDYDIEHRIVRKSDGEVRVVHQQAKIVNEDGATHLIGSIKDVTDTRRGELAQQILGGLLHVCSACRRIQSGSEDSAWYSMEGYLRLHSAAKFSHGMCPDCSKQWFPDARDTAAEETRQR
jgi:PAS domain S-box-containing protein